MPAERRARLSQRSCAIPISQVLVRSRLLLTDSVRVEKRRPGDVLRVLGRRKNGKGEAIDGSDVGAAEALERPVRARPRRHRLHGCPRSAVSCGAVLRQWRRRRQGRRWRKRRRRQWRERRRRREQRRQRRDVVPAAQGLGGTGEAVREPAAVEGAPERAARSRTRPEPEPCPEPEPEPEPDALPSPPEAGSLSPGPPRPQLPRVGMRGGAEVPGGGAAFRVPAVPRVALGPDFAPCRVLPVDTRLDDVRLLLDGRAAARAASCPSLRPP